jgi:ribonuclease BN (tRNA processing enzyme)
MKKLGLLFGLVVLLSGCAKEPSDMEKRLYGEWVGESDVAHVFFSSNHRMHVTGFGAVLEKMKWKPQEQYSGAKKIQVYVYDYEMTEKAKNLLKQFGNYAVEDEKKQHYPAVFTYVLTEDNTLDVYDDKGKKTEVLHKVSGEQEPGRE